MVKKSLLSKMHLTGELAELLSSCELIFPESREELLELTFGDNRRDLYEVAYITPNRGRFVEATVTRCKNGIAVNYSEPYMRRRDPNAMVIADDEPTDKTRFRQRYGRDFEPIRSETFAWLANRRRLIVLPFMSGDAKRGYPTLLIAPENTGFFATALADLQGFIPLSRVPDGFSPVAAIYLAPPFRHTHFDGQQVVVHNRLPGMHELFAYNLYPGPSAKKGVYGILLTKGVQEDWLTLHCSTVRLVTPYDNEFVIMHEGSSGSGKSEMTQQIHREADGRILVAENIITHEQHYIDLADTCELHPVTDDMALAYTHTQSRGRRLAVRDAEAGWFMRVDHLTQYGTEPQLEKLCISPPQPLLFLNIDAQPRSTCLVWEHILDKPGKPCPNPRVIMPRRFVENSVDGTVEVDVRSFGVRTPPSTREKPNYGIIGMLHILPAALAWLWRLVSPRGHSNPSIVTTEGLVSEGVGSYWPFATDRRVNHANLLLEMIRQTSRTRFVLIPNQYIGANRVGFKPEWIAREYIARRGSVNFRSGQAQPARCPLLGYTPPSLRVNGQEMPGGMLRVHEQIEVGEEGYDAGAQILTAFFHAELDQFNIPELHPKGRAIIDLCLHNAEVKEYEQLFGR